MYGLQAQVEAALLSVQLVLRVVRGHSALLLISRISCVMEDERHAAMNGAQDASGVLPPGDFVLQESTWGS